MALRSFSICRPTDHVLLSKLIKAQRTSSNLAPELTGRIKALSRQQGATLFMTLVAGFQALLYRYTGQDDFVIGTPVANRSRQEVEPLIGFFVNLLVLRSELNAEMTFVDHLRRVREDSARRLRASGSSV